MMTLNQIVAVAMVFGATTALTRLDAVATDPALASHYRLDAVRGRLLEQLGETEAARTHYQRAARHTRSLPEQRYLLARGRHRRPAIQPPAASPPATAPTPATEPAPNRT